MIETKANKKKVGRPRKSVDRILIDSLCGAIASKEFIAEALLLKENEQHILNKNLDKYVKVNASSVKTKCHWLVEQIKKEWNMNFLEYRKKKESVHNIKLYRKMLELAYAGSVPMCIFLSKNRLGFSDKPEGEDTIERNTITLNYKV